MISSKDSLNARRRLACGGTEFAYYSLDAAQMAGAGSLDRLPRSLKVLFENLMRHEDGEIVTTEMLLNFEPAARRQAADMELFFYPTRILLNDSAGIPLMADFAALRGAILRNGGNADMINPRIQTDMVVDHSVMVDYFGTERAFDENLALEFSRNDERYRFLRWAQNAFTNFRVIPPGTGICHQVNLEFLSRGIWTTQEGDRETLVFPETLLGTDSHTPMINGIGVLGWGVGGIEAGTALLGQPVTMTMPRVVGCHLVGTPTPGVIATDVVLHLTERLRAHGVVGSFVEFYGEGISNLTLSDRATIANMAPEYGATMGFFPWDEETVRYFERTGRGGSNVELLETYARAQGLWHDPSKEQPAFVESMEFDLSSVVPSIAGPRRPQDRLALTDAAEAFRNDVDATAAPLPAGGVPVAGSDYKINHGHIVIAAITSCTNTSNPAAMLTAGLLAKKAVERGIRPKPWVKTSLAPGSRVVAAYLTDSGLQPYLDALGYQVIGYGCMTCMGNSGPIDDAITDSVTAHNVVAAAVLSGNRNFEGRIHPLAKVNYICSPPMVIAYALAGSMAIDVTRQPLGLDADGKPVYLAELWPGPESVAPFLDGALTPSHFDNCYADAFVGEERWRSLTAPEGMVFHWENGSAYIKEPPFFDDLSGETPPRTDLTNARILSVLGDSVTTDHISPIGTIMPDSAAGQYLRGLGIEPASFNSFGSRRVNHDVMIRGTFANTRIRNEMVPERDGGWTRLQPDGNIVPIHEAAEAYAADRTPLVVVAGTEYGTGSSRDWAAKGTRLLGIRAIIAESFERIHRSNLISLGVLPLQFMAGDNRHSLRLDGFERIDIAGLENLSPRDTVLCSITRIDGSVDHIDLLCRIDTAIELEYYSNGGALHFVGRKFLGS